MNLVAPFSISQSDISSYLETFFTSPENRTINALEQKASLCKFDSDEIKNQFLEQGRHMLTKFD